MEEYDERWTQEDGKCRTIEEIVEAPFNPFMRAAKDSVLAKTNLSLLHGYPPKHNAISVASALVTKPLSSGAYLLLQRIAFSTLRHSAYVVFISLHSEGI